MFKHREYKTDVNLLKKILLGFISGTFLMLIGINVVIGNTIERLPPEKIPNRTEAFVEIFDTLYYMYPEANYGTKSVVLLLKDMNETDYGYAVSGISDYCTTNGISLLCFPYKEYPEESELLNENNLVFIFDKVRYPRSISGEDIKVTFHAQKYRPNATGFFLNVCCEWKLESWNCYWTESKEIDVS